nr:probable glycosyltransferase At5g03795 [Tanacetum cinerariifolium]
MGDEHLDTIPAAKSDEVIKSSVEDLIPIPSESEGIPDTMYDVHLVNNPTPLEAKDHFEIFINSNDDYSSSDEDSLYESIDTTTHFDISLLEYEAFCFYDDHIEEISSGSTTTTFDISLSEYDSFIFDLSNDQFPPTDRSDFTNEEFGHEPAHIISPPEYDCFYFRNLPDLVQVRDIPNLKQILEGISQTQYLRMHRRVKKVQRHFVINETPKRLLHGQMVRVIVVYGMGSTAVRVMLNLADNKFRFSQIPSGIGSDYFSGPIPPLGSLTKLTHLSLEFNSFDRSNLCDWLGTFPNLLYLDLRWKLLDWLGKLNKIIHLNLGGQPVW